MIKPVVKDHRWDDKPNEFWKLFSQKMGDAKVYFGIINNSMIYYVRDAVSYAWEHHKGYQVKKKVEFIWRWLKMLEHRVKNHPLGYFEPENFSATRRKAFSDDVTVDKLYENWVMSAGEPYMMLKDAANVFRHRCKLIMTDWKCPYPDIIAYLTTAQWLLNSQTETYNIWVNDLSEMTAITKDSCKQQLSCFNLVELRDALEKLMFVIYPESETKVFSELELHQLKLAWESIDAVMGSTEYLFNGTLSAIEEDEDIYKTKGYKKKMLQAMSECKQAFDEEYDKELKNRKQ